MPHGKRETSPRISKLAGDYMNITGAELEALIGEKGADAVADDIQSIAASAVGQDETPGDQ